MLRVEKEEFTKARNSKELFQAFETPTDSTRPTQKGSMGALRLFAMGEVQPFSPPARMCLPLIG
jgi:hypothetical protein